MKIKCIVMQKALDLHGTDIAGGITIDAKKYPGVKMSLVAEGVMIEHKGITGLIPLPGIKLIVVEKDASRTTKSA